LRIFRAGCLIVRSIRTDIVTPALNVFHDGANGHDLAKRLTQVPMEIFNGAALERRDSN